MYLFNTSIVMAINNLIKKTLNSLFSDIKNEMIQYFTDHDFYYHGGKMIDVDRIIAILMRSLYEMITKIISSGDNMSPSSVIVVICNDQANLDIIKKIISFVMFQQSHNHSISFLRGEEISEECILYCSRCKDNEIDNDEGSDYGDFEYTGEMITLFPCKSCGGRGFNTYQIIEVDIKIHKLTAENEYTPLDIFILMQMNGIPMDVILIIIDIIAELPHPEHKNLKLDGFNELLFDGFNELSLS